MTIIGGFFGLLFTLLWYGFLGVCALLLVLYCSPFFIHFSGSVGRAEKSGAGSIACIHPAIVRITFETGGAAPRFYLFNRTWGRRDDPHSSDDESSPTSDEPDLPPPLPDEPSMDVSAQERDDTPEDPTIPHDDQPVYPGEDQLPDEHIRTAPTPASAPARHTPPVADSDQTENEFFLATNVDPDPATPPDADAPTADETSDRSRSGPGWFSRMKMKWHGSIAGRLYRQRKRLQKVIRWFFASIPPFFRIVRITGARGSLTLHLSDPCTTGIVCSQLQALGYALKTRRRERFSFVCTPCFEQRPIVFCGTIGIRSSFFMLTWPVLRMVLTFPWISAFLIYWKGIRKKKKKKDNRA